MENEQDKTSYELKYMMSEKEKAEWREAFFEATERMLRTEERFQNYFKDKDPTSVDRFIKYYCSRRLFWYEHSQTRQQFLRSPRNQWNKTAEYFALLIQDYKLRKLRNEWAAGRAQVEGVSKLIDFLLLRYDMLNSPVLTPISEQEMKAFLQFFDHMDAHWEEQTGYDGEDHFSWHPKFRTDDWDYYRHEFYDWMAKAEGVDPSFPELAKRKEWEEAIIHVGRQKYHEENAKKEEERLAGLSPEEREKALAMKAYSNDKRPYLHTIFYPWKNLEKAVRLLEPTEVVDNMLSVMRFDSEQARIERIETIDLDLSKLKEYMALEDNDDWRLAMYRANHQRKLNSVRESLMPWWEGYWQQVSSGQPYEYLSEGHKKDFRADAGSILFGFYEDGLRLSGLPPDYRPQL